MQLKSITVFKNVDEIGIFHIPINSLIYIEDSGENVAKLIKIISKEGINEDTTIGEFLTNKDLYLDIIKENETPNVLVRSYNKNTDSLGYIVNDHLMNDQGEHALPGNNSYDFATAPGNLYSTGASSANSVIFGSYTRATGEGSIAAGYASKAEGNYSIAIGFKVNAQGNGSVATGYGTIAQNNYMHAEGKFNIGSSVDTIYEIGIGDDEANRSNAFEVYKDGKIIAPQLTSNLIDDGDNKTLVTKEWVQANTSTVEYLGDLLDVTISTSEGEQLLKYDADNNQWVNATVIADGGNF